MNSSSLARIRSLRRPVLPAGAVSHLSPALVVALGMSLLSSSAFAASGNWNVDAAGNWNTPGNWSPAAVPGTAAGDVVGLNFNLTAARIVTLNTAATVGTLNIGDPTAPFFSYTLSTATAQTLTFNNSGSGANLVQATAGGAADTNSVPVTLADNLTVANVNGLTLSGVISGTGNITKNGAGTLTINNANTYVGNWVVNAGTLYTPRTAANNGASGAFGNVSGGGATITINAGATLASGNNNWFGNQTLADGSLPTIYINGGTLAITNNYTTIGALFLTNGATVTSTTAGSGSYQGFQLRDGVTVGGTSASTMTGARQYHLAANTDFVVPDATGSSAPDLIVATGLINQSGDFGNAAGGLTKDGNGTMLMTAASSYTGITTINAGILQLGDGSSANGSVAGNIDNEATLVIANPNALTYAGVISSSAGGTVIKTGAGTLTLSGANTYGGSTTVSNGLLLVSAPQSLGGSFTVADGKAIGVTATADTTYFSPGSLTLGGSTGATLQFGVFGTTTVPLTPAALTINGTATINISSCPFVNGVTYPLFNNYTSGTLALGSQPAGVLGHLTVSGNTVSYQVTNLVIDVWTAAASTNWDTTTANWTNSVGQNLFTANFPVQFDDTASGAGPLLVNITPSAVLAGNMVVSNMTKSYIIGGLGIGGSGSLTMAGANSLTLTGTNTFTGPTTISGGTLVIGGAGQLGGGAYSAAIADNTALIDNSSANQTLSGIISGSGSVTNYGSGTLLLSGANTFSGGLTVTNGAVSLGNNTAAGSGGTITMAGGKLQTSGAFTIANNIVAQAGTTTTMDALGNFTLNGNISGGGTITRGAGATQSVYLFGDDSGFTGTFQDQNNAAAVMRYSAGTAGSASARWIFNQAANNGRTTLNFSTATIYFGSVTGAGFLAAQGPGTDTVEVGALGLNETFSGVFLNSGAVMAVNKVGTGTWTLSGANTYTGGFNLNGGVAKAGIVQNAAVSGPFGASGAISFGGGTLQYSSVNQFDYSPRIANSTAAISIDLNGTNVTFASALPANNTGGLVLTNSTSTGKLTLTSSANVYTGNTLIQAGTLALSGSGNIGSSANINVSSGATFDVSGVTYTLGGSQTLLGSGTVTGAVTTASSGSSIVPAAVGVPGTLTFNNNLNLNSGASVFLDLSTSHLSGNDQIVVGGNLTLSGSDTIHVNALSGPANLDQTADYVLFSVAGTSTITSPFLVFDGTAPANASHYGVQKAGNNVVLHYSASLGPVVNSVIVTNTLDGSTIATRGQTVTVFANVTPGVGTITNVSANLSSLGGSASQVMNSLGGGNYSYTMTVGSSAVVGNDLVGVTATDTAPLSGAGSATLTVNATTETWNGLALDNNWSSGTNWVSMLPPGFSGDSLIFDGSTQTTPNMNNNYAVASLTFDGTASSFTITNPAGTALTLNGTIENDSGNPQTLNVPIVLGTTETINDAGSAGITLAGAVTGFGGLTAGAGTVTLSGSNSYAGDTTVNAALKVGNSAALPNGSGKGNVMVNGTLDLNGTNAAVNGVNGAGTVDNTSATSASALTIGNNNQSSSISGTIQNSGGTNLALVKVGSGDLALSGANTYAGGTTVSNGSLTLGSGAGAGTGTITLAGGSLISSQLITIDNNILAQTNTTSIIDVNLNLTIDGNLMGGGTITRGGAAVQSLYLGGDDSGFTGTYQDQNNANSITRFTAATSGSASAHWIFNQAQNLTRTAMQFSGGTISFGSISGAGFLSENGAFVNTVEVGALGLNDTFTGSFQDNGGVLSLNKVGAGTLTLSGANAYSGLTTVSNGTLVISTLFAGGGDFVVNDNQALGAINNGGVQTALLGNLTLGDTAGPTMLFFTNVVSTTTPVITAASAVTLNGTCNLAISNSVVNSGGVYPLVKYGSLGGAGSFVLASVPSGVTATLTNDTSNLWIALRVSVGNGVNTTPTNITTSVSGNTLTLSWPADHTGWHLQVQTNSLSSGLGTNWVTIPNSSLGNSYTNTINAANGTVFFRMIYP